MKYETVSLHVIIQGFVSWKCFNNNCFAFEIDAFAAVVRTKSNSSLFDVVKWSYWTLWLTNCLNVLNISKSIVLKLQSF